MFHYTIRTALSPDEAIAALTESLKTEKFGVLWQLDMKEKLREKGVQFDRTYRILEVCNPVEAERVLSEDAMVGYFLPCKLAVYEEDGSTRVGMPRPTALIGLTGNKALQAIAVDMEKRLISCIDEAVGDRAGSGKQKAASTPDKGGQAARA